MKMNFYAKLNNDRVCEQIVSTPKVIANTTDYIEIDNYNDDLVWRKWEGDQWSAKKYIPNIDPSIQEQLDKVTELDKSNKELIELLNAKEASIETLKESVNVLSDTIDFIIKQGGDI